jgi:cytosine/adenosine deaminase-related metal-dependent hydrolase
MWVTTQPTKGADMSDEDTALDLQQARFDPTSSTLVKQAIIITGADQGTLRGDLLLRDGHVVDVAPHLDVADAEVVDGFAYIVSPGFIDTHRHLWQTLYKGFMYDMTVLEVFAKLYGVHSTRYTADDMYAATMVGRLAALDAGITTLLDWAHNVSTPEMEDAGIQALKDAGGRSVFGHGFVGDRVSDIPRYYDVPRTFEVAERIRKLLPDDDALVSSCYLGLEPNLQISMAACKREFEIARELGMRLSIHINSMGLDGAGGATRWDSLQAMHAEGLMGDDVTYVHLTGSTDLGLKLIADTGGTASISPQVEAHIPSFTVPPVGRLLMAGVRPSISLDTPGGGSEDFFSQMRAMFDIERAVTENQFEPRPEGYKLTLPDVFEFATLQGARALGQEDRLGTLEPGKVADLLFFRTDSPNMLPVLEPLAAVMFHSTIGDIDTVLVHGRPVKRGGRLLADLTDVRNRVEESVARLYWKAEDLPDLPADAIRPHPATANLFCG